MSRNVSLKGASAPPNQGLQVEERVEPDGEPGAVANGADREQYARHIRGAFERVVTDSERLSRRTEDDLLVGKEASEPNRVHPDSGRALAAPRTFGDQLL